MKFETKKRRLQHPLAGRIPTSEWVAFFCGELSGFQCELMQATADELEETLDQLTEQPEDAHGHTRSGRIATWLALFFAHRDLSDDTLFNFAKKLNLSLEEQFLIAAITGKLSMFEAIISTASNNNMLEAIIAAPDYLKNDRVKVANFAVFHWAAQNGHLNIINRLVELAPDKIQDMIIAKNYEAFCKAAKNGHLNIINRLVELAPDRTQDMIEKAFLGAAQGGNLHIIERFIELAPDKIQDMIEEGFSNAAKNGHLHIIEGLIKLIPEIEKESRIKDCAKIIFAQAADYGHLDIIQFIEPFIPKNKLKITLISTTEHASLEVINHLLNLVDEDKRTELVKENLLYDEYAPISNAAKHGHLAVMERLLELLPEHEREGLYKEDWLSDIILAATRNGHLDVMNRLLELAPNDEDQREEMLLAVFRTAAQNVHIHIMERVIELVPNEQLQELLTYSNYEYVRQAALNGHLNIINLLIEISPNEHQRSIMLVAFSAAAQNGQLHMINELIKLSSHDLLQSVDFIEILYLTQSSKHSRILNRLLTIASIFDSSEAACLPNMMEPILLFINKQLTALKAQAATPNNVFNIEDPEQAKLCFYMVRNMIRRGDATLLEDMRFLINIPAVKALLHTEVTPNHPNELLRLAQQLNHQEAAAMLLEIPAVYDLAENNNFYINETQNQLNLRALAQNSESSMKRLTPGEQACLKQAQECYESETEAKTDTSIIETLRNALVNRYNSAPASITCENGARRTLPMMWDELQGLNLNEHDKALAFKAYYQNENHTAWRYLEKPNHWIASDDIWAHRDKEDPSIRWSTFEEYQSLIALCFLAAQDEKTPPTDDYTFETRVEHFINELAHLGRAHNWDKSRKRTRDNEHEEYDDLEGDRPSCSWGIKRRLFQSVQGHPLFKMLTMDIIKQELREFVRAHFIQCIKNQPEEAIQWNESWKKSFETGSNAEGLEAMNIPKEAQELFLKHLGGKYPNQFNKTLEFKQYIERRFKLNQTYPTHAAIFDGETKLTALLEVCVKTKKQNTNTYAMFQEKSPEKNNNMDVDETPKSTSSKTPGSS